MDTKVIVKTVKIAPDSAYLYQFMWELSVVY